MQKFNPRSLTAGALILVMAAMRTISSIGLDHNPLINLTPLGSMALFSGAYFSKKNKAFLFPLLTLWLSDLLLDRLVYYHDWRWFYHGFYWTYGAFALMVVVGNWLLKKISLQNIGLATLLVILIHWILTDLGVWIEGTLYPPTAAGYWACLVAAIPYELQILAGALIYNGLFFGLFEWMQRRYPAALHARPNRLSSPGGSRGSHSAHPPETI